MSTENVKPDNTEADRKEICDRLATLEQELAKNKRLSIATSVLTLLLGGSGILGVLQWMSTIPKMRTDISATQSQVEESKAKIAQATLDYQVKIHEEQVRSAERELADAKQVGDKKTMMEVTRQISVNERGYRAVLTQLSVRLSVVEHK